MESRRAWHYWPHLETPTEFELFSRWLAFGADTPAMRRLATERRELHATLGGLMHRAHWRARADAHRAWLDSIRDSAAERTAVTQGQLIARSRKALGRALKIADRAVREAEEQQDRTATSVGFVPLDVAVRVVLGVPRALSALAEPDKPEPVELDYSRFTEEELVELQRLERKARGA